MIVVLLLSLSVRFAADQKADPEVFPAGLLRFDGASVHPVLDIYKELSGMALVMSSNVNSLAATITMKSQVALTRPEALVPISVPAVPPRFEAPPPATPPQK